MYVVIAYIPSTHTLGRTWQCEAWERVEEVAKEIAISEGGSPLSEGDLMELEDTNCLLLPNVEIHAGLLE